MELCAKLAIVRVILQEEGESKRKILPDSSPPVFNFKLMDGTWYPAFMQVFESPREALPERLQSVSLVVFNYDRCVEHYLYVHLQMVYGYSPTEAAELVGNMQIYHPYGTVGNLPWMQVDGSSTTWVEPSRKGCLNL